MTEPINLYCKGADTWHQWLGGDVLHEAGDLKQLTDDLCDAVGGANIVTVDMADEAWICLPCTTTIGYRVDRLMSLKVEQVRYDIDTIGFGWKVLTWGTFHCTYGVAQDDPVELLQHLCDFIASVREEDDE